MSDARHKKPPAKGPKEDVTEAFRKLVRTTLEQNETRNNLTGAQRDDPDYLISTHAELAEVTGLDKSWLGRVIGNVRSTSKAKPINRAANLGLIRSALQLPPMVSLQVRASRAAVLQAIAELPDDTFQALAERIAKTDKAQK